MSRRQVSICTSRPRFMLHISMYSCRCRFMSFLAVASSSCGGGRAGPPGQQGPSPAPGRLTCQAPRAGAQAAVVEVTDSDFKLNQLKAEGA